MGETITIQTSSSTDVVKVIERGPQGPAGQGVPVGGTTGQVLRKASGTNYDTEWAAAGSGSGSVTSVTGTAPIVSSGGTTPAISISAATAEAAGSMSAADKTKLDGIAAGAEVNVNADWNASSGDAQILNKPTLGAAASLNVGTTAGTVAAGDDARLSDSRPPTSHTHVSADISDATDAATANAIVRRDATQGAKFGGSLDAQDVYASGIVDGYMFVENGFSIESKYAAISHTHAAADITSGTLDIARIPTGTSSTTVCIGDDARLSDSRTPASHTHGNITNDGLVGTTANLPLKTGTGGIVEAGAFGTGAGEFSEGNHTHSDLHTRSHAITSTSDHTAGTHKVFYSNGSGEIVELALGNSGEVLTSNGASAAPSFAAASGGVTGAASSASDVLGVSGSDITGVDAGSDKIVFWDDSASELTYLATVGPTFDGTTLRWPVELVIACSDESTNLTTGTAKVTFRAPYAFLLTGVRASVNTAPTGSTLIVDINNGANSALSTKLSIDASEKTSTTAASAAVIDTTYDDISDDAEITIDIDQIGSTIAGKGLKVTLIGTRA